MNRLEKIFGFFKRVKAKELRDPHAKMLHQLQHTTANPLHVPGDFYVQCDSCIFCGAPETEAPDLMEMNDTGCYFKKQPETEEETARAINALAVSCISAVRYRGTDEQILKKIIDVGGRAECDYLM